jgi:hypothetical protein
LGGLVALHQAVHDGLQRLQQLALGRVRLQLHRHHAIDLEVVVVAGGVQLGAQVEDDVRVGGRRQLGRGVVGLEGRQDFLGVVHEIHHVGRVLAGIGAVQAGQRLHGLDAGQATVHVHAAQQRLVEAGLELVRHQQDLVFVALEGFADLAAIQTRVQVAAGFRETARGRIPCRSPRPRKATRVPIV